MSKMVPRNVEKTDEGWTLTFALEDGDFPVHISMAKIVSCVGTAASDEETSPAARRLRDDG